MNGTSGFLKETASKVSFGSRAYNGLYASDFLVRTRKNSNRVFSYVT